LPFNVSLSTPSEYVSALKAERVKYPVFSGDLEPFSESNNEVFSGFFSSKPSLKKQVKDASALFKAQNRYFATKMLDNNATDAEIKDILSAKDKMLDALGVIEDHNSISGATRELVQLDNVQRLSQAEAQSNKLFVAHLAHSVSE